MAIRNGPVGIGNGGDDGDGDAASLIEDRSANWAGTNWGVSPNWHFASDLAFSFLRFLRFRPVEGV